MGIKEILMLLPNLFTLEHLIYLLLFVLYELLFKIYVINKIEWRVKKNILKEQTDVVENVKALYLKELELIKAANTNETETLKHTLDRLLAQQIQHSTEERQAMVNFMSSCNQWIFNLSRIKIEDYGLQNTDELKIKIANIRDEYFLKIYAERTKILLYITNQEVNNKMTFLVDSIDEYKIKMENFLTELLKLLQQQFNS